MASYGGGGEKQYGSYNTTLYIFGSLSLLDTSDMNTEYGHSLVLFVFQKVSNQLFGFRLAILRLVHPLDIAYIWEYKQGTI